VVLDYLFKPVRPGWLADTVLRLKAQLSAAQPAVNTDALLLQLTTQLRQRSATAARRPTRR
jgi:hypothetical protein